MKQVCLVLLHAFIVVISCNRPAADLQDVNSDAIKALENATAAFDKESEKCLREMESLAHKIEAKDKASFILSKMQRVNETFKVTFKSLERIQLAAKAKLDSLQLDQTTVVGTDVLKPVFEVSGLHSNLQNLRDTLNKYALDYMPETLSVEAYGLNQMSGASVVTVQSRLILWRNRLAYIRYFVLSRMRYSLCIIPIQYF